MILIKSELQKKYDYLELDYSILKQNHSELTKEVEELRKKVKLSDEIILRDKNELNKVYPYLHKFKRGYNKINYRALQSIEISGSEIIITYKNKTSKDIQPELNLYFVNSMGYMTESYFDNWVFSSIAPGETRKQTGYVEFSFGDPTYFWFNLTTD